MFTAVPPRYDLINRIITWSMDKQWRRKAAEECLASRPKKFLDLCCGTGDLGVELARLVEEDVELTGVDYSLPMLEIACRKLEHLTTGRKITFIYGDVANLPFPDGHFDCIGISFAFRNLTYKNPVVQRYLAEVLRVLKTGGRFVVVETSQPETKLIRRLFHLYLRWFVFRVGYMLSGNRGAYHYLAESASKFYSADEVKELLLTAGFNRVLSHKLFLGVTAIYTAIK